MVVIDYSGHVIDERYRLTRLIGQGGMGAVYLGQHIGLRKKVAIKILHAELAREDKLCERFFREAQVIADINHQNIANVIDVGVSFRGDVYMVMEYLAGECLADILHRVGPMDLAAVCGIMEPVLLALDAVHGKEIVHRDLKPGNIFIAYRYPNKKPTVKLIDFGISRFSRDTITTSIDEGGVIGTPVYMSPEQIRGDKNVDHRTDIYSAGITMYRMLSGKLPFEGTQYHEQLAATLNLKPTPPRESYADFPVEAEPLIMRALRKNPNERPQNAREMLDDLHRLSEFHKRHAGLTRFVSDFATPSAGTSTSKTVTSAESGGRALTRETNRINVPHRPVRRESGIAFPETRGMSYKKTAGIALVACTLFFLGWFFYFKWENDVSATRGQVSTTVGQLDGGGTPPASTGSENKITEVRPNNVINPLSSRGDVPENDRGAGQEKDDKKISRPGIEEKKEAKRLPSKSREKSTIPSLPISKKTTLTADRGPFGMGATATKKTPKVNRGPFGTGVSIELSDLINEGYGKRARDK